MTVQRSFRPNGWLTVLTLLLIALFARLGVWQLDRAEEKQQVLSAYAQKMSLPRLELNNKNIETVESYQRVVVNGQADAEHQILLDNKIHKGRVGFQVLLPVKISGSEKWILVNRGWLPMGQNRNVIPDISVDRSIQRFHGVVKLPLGDEFKLGDGNLWDNNWPQLIQWLDVNEAATHLAYDMVPYILLQSEDDADAYIRDWKMIASSPDKSISYAVQWFSFAIILLGLFLFLNYKRMPPGER
ncbi:MAG: SURF1 family protein [Gammaproteobacteria bacterium]|nr:SURF1 family protein [Gammaproteobacteria bacterium]